VSAIRSSRLTTEPPVCRPCVSEAREHAGDRPLPVLQLIDELPPMSRMDSALIALTSPSGVSSTEPLEPSEPSVPPSMQGRLCGERDGSVEEEDRTAARARALGIEVPLYKRFPCILADHDHDAQLHPTTAGYWQYRCEGLTRGVGLAEVRAFIGHGVERYISPLGAAHWRERLDFEAHLRWPIALDAQLPDDCPEPAAVLAARMREFVGLRDPRFPLAEPFIFAHDFAQAYCDLTADRVRSAKDFLQRARVTYRAGRHGRSIRWKLAAQDHEARGLRVVGGGDV
jgi:hypothetical protein